MLSKNCTDLRRKVLTVGTLNLTTGEMETDYSVTVTQMCDTPLFGEDEKATGRCQECLEGWQVEGNRPATPEETAEFLGFEGVGI